MKRYHHEYDANCMCPDCFEQSPYTADHFGMYTVIHYDNMNSTVFHADGTVIQEFKQSELAWQDANRLARDLFFENLYKEIKEHEANK